ncbi:MAG: hypothetical protein ACI9K1_001568 [Arcticibacterium sp.]|jgi:hypothetical protein
MIKKLEDCKIGDTVRIWCIGWNAWDNEVVNIIDNGVSSLIKVKYCSGRTREFVPSAGCMVVGS